MPRKPVFNFGEPISQSESLAVKKRLRPEMTPAGRRKPWNVVVQFLPPMRLEHEVNRLRGYAFDSNEVLT